MTLTVAHLRTRLRTPVPIAPARIESWHAAFAAQDDAALGVELGSDDEWLLIRRLRIETRWREDATDADVGASWASALRHAIGVTIDDGAPNCIRYASRRAALADMLYRSALGEQTRQWAWHRVGLIARPDVTPAEALDAAVEEISRAPELIWPVLQRIIAAEETTAALTALLRALPASSWTRLLAASPRTAPFARWMNEPMREPARAVAAADDADLRASSQARRLLAWAATRRYFVQRHVETLAALIAALAWSPSAARSDVSRRRMELARLRLAATGTDPRQASRPSYPPRIADRSDATDKSQVAPVRPTRPDLSELPALPDTARWESTNWAGALFWLGRVATSGILEWIDTQADAPADALRLVMCALARALGIPEDDCVFALFCGGTVPRAEPPDEITRRATALAASWSAWLDTAAPELAEPRLTTVCRRGGRLRVEPGWIELHLPLATVDTTIRRLGLDLDPGWLPWIGCVLRICYDD